MKYGPEEGFPCYQCGKMVGDTEWVASWGSCHSCFNKSYTLYLRDLEIQEACEILDALIDDKDCRHDHHGYCQEHMFLTGPCAIKQAKKFIERNKK